MSILKAVPSWTPSLDLGALKNKATDADPAAFLRSLGAAGIGALRHPRGTAAAHARLLLGSGSALRTAAGRAIGRTTPGPVTPTAGDKRFSDNAYQENAAYFYLAQQYLLVEHLINELIDTAELNDDTAVKARFAARFILDGLIPTNTIPGNPAAIRKAFDTGGLSLVRGLRNFVHDLRHNGGWPSQVDRSQFAVGVDLGATPGSVVYRSDLIEVIQYTPQTTDVYATPLLFCPPWINKFYIMDLAPGKSLIEWAIQHGHTCFAISYRNPDASMSGLGFRDYLFDGPLDAVRVVREITGSETVNTVSICLGGTLTALALAYNAAQDDPSIGSATFINTHTDFAEPGILGAFTDEDTIAALERQMARTGYLDSAQMARTFSALRANDLIFQYVVNNWLLGNKPPAFDLLAWNADSTRMPARMHGEYLRSCYLRNEFSQGEFEINGEFLDPSSVDVDSYIVAAVNDHVVPWTSSYKTTGLLGGDSRFVLSTSGHIAGIVNPPNPKAKHWVNNTLTADPHKWKAAAELRDGTWWLDWAKWLAGRAGAKRPAAPALGSAEYPPLDDAPGLYVREEA
ncbi:MAG: alpha/beta fold hydrolase [Rhodococcus sp. (in: high G+C Gram-positive bacteria)]